MTTTDAPSEEERAHSSVWVHVDEEAGGNVTVRVDWVSESPWVPAGQLRLSSRDERLSGMSSSLIVEAILKQLRLTMQGMLSEVWPPF